MSIAHAAHVYRITSWFGAITDGIQAAEFTGSSNPDVVMPAWGRASLVIAARWGIGPAGSASVSGVTYPTGYTTGASTFADGAAAAADTALQTAYKRTIGSIEDAGAFGGTFSGFSEVHTIAVAVRGDTGGVTDGPETITVNDTDSQDDHNSIRTFSNDDSLFATDTDATTWANLVLTTYADDRPILTISFAATKSPAYRAQAYTRRVGDKITLVADNNAGLGISADFFIESIGHKFSRGMTSWIVEWELSPA